jgi:hypothetical protein
MTPPLVIASLVPAKMGLNDTMLGAHKDVASQP